jgi:hypothetical protein
MKSFLYIYALLVLVTGVSAWSNSGWFVGMVGLLGPMLACWAGIGVRASLFVGDKRGILLAVVLGGAMYWIADWLVTAYGYSVTLYSVTVGGGLWILVGFVVSFIATSKTDTTLETEVQQ